MALKHCCGVLFFDAKNERVLLFKRDNKPNIPFPGSYDILGGKVEDGETPDEAIAREMAEELDDLRTGQPYELKGYQLFSRYVDYKFTEQSIYWVEADFEKTDIRLKEEGERVDWFCEKDLENTELAFGFNDVVKLFFQSRKGRSN